MPRDSSSQADGLATLRKVLQLEEGRAYDNRAVVGGLAAFISRAAGSIAFPPDVRRQIAFYDQLSRDERAATIAAIRGLLEGALRPEAGSPPRPDPPRESPSSTLPIAPAPSESAARANRSPSRPSLPARPSQPKRTPEPGRKAPLREDSPVASIPGIGPTRARQLATLGVEKVGQLRWHFPHRYVHYPPPQPAASLMFQPIASFEGVVRRVDVAPLPGKRFRITATLADQTGTVAAVWIRGGGVPSQIHEGVRLAISGPVVTAGRQVVFENPEMEPANVPPLNTRRTVPVYPLTAGLSQPFVRSVVRRAMDELPPVAETLPADLLESEGMMPLDAALREIHAPSSSEQLEAARVRLSFDELLPIQMLVLQRRLAYQVVQTTPIETPWSLLAEFRQRLPFALTGAQQRVLSTILRDMARPEPMVRLLQGEVGSGKTVVAAMSLLAAVAAGGQGALMAPTEILAEQHLRTLTRLYEGASPALEQALGHPLRLGFLSGALTRSERQRSLAAIAAGEVDLVVGTHAVIQSDVEFPRLLLAVVDEQHRFGVNQRIAARRKGENPHLLVMTATPIPRTLALTLYGDLDLSLLDEVPAGRQPIETILLRPLGRPQAYQHIKEQVAAGRQAFVICPLVEGSPSVEAKAATEEYERLRTGELASLRLALLHGRMRPAEKDQIMRDFGAGEYDVLVATSVVEVGVDVPNATIMVIEGAERFGLAQLHQFRGRIGRGSHAGTCYLVAGNESPEAMERLEAVVRSSNGLELAEEDLRLRGPGDYFGVRQSGLPTLRIARLTDLDFVQRVRQVAACILESDPHLERPEHASLAARVCELATSGGEAN